MNQHYDIIGDIHGHADELEALLDKMNYVKRDGVYRHESRQPVFMGDFIDRGHKQREVIEIVRPMIETGMALSVIGNHEFNALAFHTPKPGTENEFLRPNNKKNTDQHQAFLDAYPDSVERTDVLDFFKSIPLWLDLGAIRVIHACWSDEHINALQPLLDVNNCLDDDFLVKASTRGSNEYIAAEMLLKGPEVKLPIGQAFKDKDKNVRHDVRIRWWLDSSKLKELSMTNPEDTNISSDTEIEDLPVEIYPANSFPVFFGHYWLKGKPEIQSTNAACVDYSVAKCGQLVCYRWSGERKLENRNFVAIQSMSQCAEQTKIRQG